MGLLNFPGHYMLKQNTHFWTFLFYSEAPFCFEFEVGWIAGNQQLDTDQIFPVSMFQVVE